MCTSNSSFNGGRLKKTILSMVWTIGAAALVISSQTIVSPYLANAANTSSFNAGNIIDDSVFYNSSSMSVADIQNFLNSKVTSCDTNHSGFTGTTGTYYGPPWVCLKNFYENPDSTYNVSFSYTGTDGSTKTDSRAYYYNNAYRYTALTPVYVNGDYRQGVDHLTATIQSVGGSIPTGAISAAQIIYNAAQQYGINPQVLIVLLQKEQGLVTDTWPAAWQYQSATGYGCPDYKPCSSGYAGFSKQVFSAAWQFKRYQTDPSSYSYIAGRNNTILWNPVSSCGSSVVYIQNQATAGLYNYTPYRPNAAALAAGYGTGDGCSSYGNRNFWLYFNDWFGPTTSIQNIIDMKIVSAPDTSPAKGQDVVYTFTLKNKADYDITLEAVGVVGRYGDVYSGPNRDFGWIGPVTIKMGETQQFSFTTTIKDVGTIYAWPALLFKNKYTHYNNWGSALISHQANISLSAPLVLSPNNPVAGQNVSLSATIKNNEDAPIHTDSLGIPVRLYGTYNYDIPWSQPGVIQAGATQDISGNITFDKPGTYSAWVSWKLGEQYAAVSSILTVEVKNVTPNFTLTYIETPNTAPSIGEEVRLKFKLKNNLSVPISLNAVGVVGRYSNPYYGPNRDFGWIGPETFAANEEKTFSIFSSIVSEPSNFYAWVAINYNNTYTHYNNWGFMMKPHKPNLSITSPLNTSPTNPAPGQNAVITSSIKNNEPQPIHYDAIGIPIRYYGVYNYDTAWVGPGVLSATGQTGDTLALTGTTKLDKAGPYTIWVSANIKGSYFAISPPTNLSL